MARRSTSLALGAFLLMATPGVAHLSWPTFHSARSAVSLGEDGLEVVVVLEVPTFRLVADFKEYFSDLDLMTEIEAGRFEDLENQFRDAQFEAFKDTLELEFDGAVPAGAWAPVDTPVNGKGTEGFFVYMFEFVFEEEPVLGQELKIRVVNRAFPGEEVVMANQAEGTDGWEVIESSIPPPEDLELPEGAVLENQEYGLWTIDPVKRNLRVTFARVGRPATRPQE